MDESFSIYYNGSCLYYGINWRFVPMKIRLMLLVCMLAVMLSACSYWVIEEAPVQVGQSTVQSE